MRKYSKNHVGVSKETYDYVFKRDKGRCVACWDDRASNLHLHHIRTRHYKGLIDDPSNCVMLCVKHHIMVHQDMQYFAPILTRIVQANEEKMKKGEIDER